MRLYLVVISSLLVASCGSTGIVKMESNTYMVAVKSAELGFVSGDGAKADAYIEANEFCQKQNKNVETIKVETRGSGLARSASAALEFKCVDSL
jgi:hypothetical protein